MQLHWTIYCTSQSSYSHLAVILYNYFFFKCGFVVLRYDLMLIIPGEKSQRILFFCDLRVFGVCMREVVSFARLCTLCAADRFCSSEGEARAQPNC